MRQERSVRHGRGRSVVALGVVAVMALLVTAVAALAAGKQDFILHNRTGAEIHKLYTSPHDVNQWEENVLGEDTLPDGGDLKITFDPKAEADRWDLKVVDGVGQAIVWDDLNLTEIAEITLYIKDGKPIAEIKKAE